MSQSLERLLPILSSIPGVNIPASFLQSVYIAASQRKIEQFGQALTSEVKVLNQNLEAQSLRLDHGYVKSEGFTANVMQALRAAELAETETKLRFIARALAGCSLVFPPPTLDKFQTMRIVEGMSDRELRVFVAYFGLLDPIDPYSDAFPADSSATVAGLTRQEFTAALLGLGQLGLLIKETVAAQPDPWTDRPASAQSWKLTVLARQVASLSRVGPVES